MSKLSLELTPGTTQHPRENQTATGNLGAANATTTIRVDGCSTITLDLRGTFNLTVQVQGSVDGTNWTLIPLRPMTGGILVPGVTGTAVGTWTGSCAGYTQVRAIVTAYTSGTVVATLAGTLGYADDFSRNGGVTSQIGTTVGAAGAAVTLTLAAPGAGLRHYLTYLSVNRFAAAALTAAATPVTVTTTNLPGSLAITVPADGAALGTMDRWREDFAFPIMSNAQNTATTIVCPATTGVIWRVTAGYYVAP